MSVGNNFYFLFIGLAGTSLEALHPLAVNVQVLPQWRIKKIKFQTMEKAYRKKILQQAEKAAIDGNTLLADGLKLLVKIYNEIDECREIEKKAAKKADYEGAIKLQGMVDAWKKTAWELQKVLNLR